MGKNHATPAAAAWANYFEKMGKTNVWRCRAPNCQFTNDRGIHSQTYYIERHLKDAHPELYQRREEALVKNGKILTTTRIRQILDRTKDNNTNNGTFGAVVSPVAVKKQRLQENEIEGMENGEEEYMDESMGSNHQIYGNGEEFGTMDGGGQGLYTTLHQTSNFDSTINSTENNGAEYEVGGHNGTSSFKDEVGQHYLNGGNGMELMAAAFENDDDDPTGNDSEEDQMLDSRLKMAKIAFFEAQAEESRARAKTEIAKERESVARESEARANERVANIRAKILELEYQEKIQNARTHQMETNAGFGQFNSNIIQ